MFSADSVKALIPGRLSGWQPCMLHAVHLKLLESFDWHCDCMNHAYPGHKVVPSLDCITELSCSFSAWCLCCCGRPPKPAVLNPNFEILTKILYNTTFSTVHYLVRDNTGRSIVIQYSGPNNLQWFENGADTPTRESLPTTLCSWSRSATTTVSLFMVLRPLRTYSSSPTFVSSESATQSTSMHATWHAGIQRQTSLQGPYSQSQRCFPEPETLSCVV